MSSENDAPQSRGMEALAHLAMRRKVNRLFPDAAAHDPIDWHKVEAVLFQRIGLPPSELRTMAVGERLKYVDLALASSSTPDTPGLADGDSPIARPAPDIPHGTVPLDPAAEFLRLAGEFFGDVGRLARDLEELHRALRLPNVPPADAGQRRKDLRQRFLGLRQPLESMRPAIEQPPAGCEAVAKVLAAFVPKFREWEKALKSSADADVTEAFPELYSTAQAGWSALNAAQQHDPLAALTRIIHGV